MLQLFVLFEGYADHPRFFSFRKIRLQLKIAFSSYNRTWLHFHAVHMMVGKKKNMRWILPVKEVGEENSGEEEEL